MATAAQAATTVEWPNLEKLQKRLCRAVGKAIADYSMIEAGDRVMVCLSGGKDSFAMLDILLLLRERAPVDFDLVNTGGAAAGAFLAGFFLPGFSSGLHTPPRRDNCPASRGYPDAGYGNRLHLPCFISLIVT